MPPHDQPAPDLETASPAERWAANYSIGHRLFRAVFGLVWLLTARWTPPQLNPWRCFVLRLFGAKIHPTAIVRGGARIWYPPNLEMMEGSVMADGVECYNMNIIRIGRNSTVSQRTFLCGGTHDYALARNPLITRPVIIGDDVWVAAEAFVGPGVTVPEGCVIGARAVVNGPLEPWTVYAGNPAVAVKPRAYDGKARLQGD